MTQLGTNIIPMSRLSRPRAVKSQPLTFSPRPTSEPPASLAYICDDCGETVAAHWFLNNWHQSECRCVEYRRQASVRREHHRTILTRIGMTGNRLSQYDLANFDPADNPQALTAAQQFVNLHIAACENPARVPDFSALVLQSTNRGIGKTFLAAAIINKILMHAYERANFDINALDQVSQRLIFCRWAYAPHIHTWALTEAKEDPIFNKQRFDSLMRCRLLVLDDIGQEHHGASGENNPSWQTHNYARILEERYTMGLSTIITTNATDLKSLIGASGFDRLEGGFVLMHGDSGRNGLQIIQHAD